MRTTDPFILITGVSGFIGRALLEHYASSDPVVGLSRKKPDVEAPFVKGEFHSWEVLRGLDDYNIRCLVHLGAVTGGCSEEDGLAVNVQGTRRLLRYLIDRGCRKFVLASSIAAVGCLDPAFLPLQVPIPDAHPCLARDAYGFSKAIMEEVAHFFHRVHSDTDFILLRIGAVSDDTTATPLTADPTTPGTITCAALARVMLSDVLRALITAVEAPYQPGVRVYNVVGPEAACRAPVPEVLRARYGDAIGHLDLSWYERPENAYAPLFAMDAIRDELGFTPQKSHRSL